MKKAWMCVQCGSECVGLDGDKFCVEQEKTPGVFLTDAEYEAMESCIKALRISIRLGRVHEVSEKRLMKLDCMEERNP